MTSVDDRLRTLWRGLSPAQKLRALKIMESIVARQDQQATPSGAVKEGAA